MLIRISYRQLLYFSLFAFNFEFFFIISVIRRFLQDSEHRAINILNVNNKINENNVKFNVEICIDSDIHLRMNEYS